MTKKQFLNKLEKELNILDEHEVKDIINEYNDIIEEKIKHGQKEKDAVAEVGDVESLAKDILSAYKVNPNYKKREGDEFTQSAKKLGEDFDSFIKKGAEKATKITQNVVDTMRENNQELTIDFIFELLFKAIAALIIMAIASLPFMLIRELGTSILGMIIYPLDSILGFCWTVIVGILYVVCCAFIFLAMFKQYFTKSQSDREKKDKKKESMKKDKNESVEEEKNSNKEEKRAPEIKVQRSTTSNTISDVIVSLVKVFVILISIPLMIWIGCVGFGIAFFISLIITGFPIYSVFILSIGVFIISLSVLSMIFSLIFSRKKIYVWPFFVGLGIMLVGGFMTFDYVLSFEYIDKLPENEYHQQVETIDVTVNENQWPVSISTNSGISEVLVDANLPTNQMRVDIEYYDDFVTMEELSNTVENDPVCDSDAMGNPTNCFHVYQIRNETVDGWKVYREIKPEFIENFQNHKIYSYRDLTVPKIKIYVNPANQDKLRRW